ncbi:MAG: ASCH domain-containing protein [Patescibacteria group bacterium]
MSDELRFPLTAILLAPEPTMWEDALSGRKQITIREGHRDYRAGTTAILCCYILNIAVQVDITEVRHCRLVQLTEDELKADGFLDLKDCMTQMKRFYPNIAFDSEVTVLRWNNIRGSIIDKYRAQFGE